MDYKKETKKAYDASAEEYHKKTKDYLRNFIFEDAKRFMDNLPGKRILDLGSGPGRDSYFFKGLGLEPLCLDLSPEMVRICKEKRLNAKVGDLEKLDFPECFFDGVWAYTSLLHVPKAKFDFVLSEIARVLVPKGALYLGMKEGDSEEFKESQTNPGMKKFFALYRDADLIKKISTHFDIVHSSKVELPTDIYLNYLAVKK